MAGTGKDSGGSPFSFSTSFTDLSSGLFGSETEQSQSGSSTKSGLSREIINSRSSNKTNVDKAALLKIIDDSLKGIGGLAEIFGLEKGAGLLKSSAAKEGTEDLIAKIAGELAKVTKEEVTTDYGVKNNYIDSTEQSTSKSTSESPGLVDQIFGGLF